MINDTRIFLIVTALIHSNCYLALIGREAARQLVSMGKDYHYANLLLTKTGADDDEETTKKEVKDEKKEPAAAAAKLLTPMRLLIRDMPGVAGQMLDQSVVTNGQKDDEDYAILMDYIKLEAIERILCQRKQILHGTMESH